MAAEPSPPDSAEPPRGFVTARAIMLLAAVLVVLVSLRAWQLDLDPPEVVVPGYSGEAHYRDEAAKAHEARNKTNWDRWSLSEVDEYAFWRAQSPAWVWGEHGWFELFGVSIVAARAFVVVHTVVALALLMWLALIRHGLPAAIATGLLLGFNWAYLIYSRLALMEGALLCWLLVATLALSQLDRRPREFGRWTALAIVAMFIACTIKQTGLLVVPAFGLALLGLGLRASGAFAEGARASGWTAWLRTHARRQPSMTAIIGVAALGLALALLILNPEYQERLAFNAEHFTASREQPVLARAVQTLVRGLFGSRLQLMFMRLAPLTMWLGTLELARIVYVVVRRRVARKRGQPMPTGPLYAMPDAIDGWMLAWALLGLLANLASPHRAIRFALVILPPAAWLGGALIGRLWTHAYARAHVALAIRTFFLGLAAIGVAGCLGRFVQWIEIDQRSAAQIGDQLEAVIGDRHAVVIGEFAAQAVFETDYWHFYVRPFQFNTDAEVLDALAVTHLVAGREDFVEEYLQDKRKDMLVGREKIGEVVFRGRTLTVWELADPAEREAKSGGRFRPDQGQKRQERERQPKPDGEGRKEPVRVREHAGQE